VHAVRVTRRVLLVVLLVALGAPPARPASGQQGSGRPVAILGIPTEIKDVEARLAGATVERVQGVAFTVGSIGRTRVILGRTWAGTVNAAMVATLLMSHFAPSAVFFTGTAGAIDPELQPGDVVVGSAVGHHDFGAATVKEFARRPTRNPLTGDQNPMFFPADERLLGAARRASRTITPGRAPGSTRASVIREGIIVTGNAFVANPAQRDELRRVLGALAVEMEGAAVAQVGWQLGVPVLIIRSITDGADGGTPDAYRVNIEAASRNAATLTMAVVAELAGQ
jgi:adenosylhomocysteine nucleosidase